MCFGGLRLCALGPMEWRGREKCAALFAEFQTFLGDTGGADATLRAKLGTALDAVVDALRLFGPRRTVGCFNGGKDAVVVFHLLAAAFASREGIRADERPQFVFFKASREFVAVEEFVDLLSSDIDVDLRVLEMRYEEGMKILLSDLREGECAAFLLGTRRSDPRGESQGVYAPSSHWLPPFMRVNPIVEWTYGDVWHFIKKFSLPYCALYDQGFTSLGTPDTTSPNPLLARPDGSFSTASSLSNWDAERSARAGFSTPHAIQSPSSCPSAALLTARGSLSLELAKAIIARFDLRRLDEMPRDADGTATIVETHTSSGCDIVIAVVEDARTVARDVASAMGRSECELESGVSYRMQGI
eukprot:Polyplicarium_translucidae@DN2553_c1_g1_i6.p1